MDNLARQGTPGRSHDTSPSPVSPACPVLETKLPMWADRFQPVFWTVVFFRFLDRFFFRFRLQAQNTTGAPDGSNRCRFFPSGRAWALGLNPSQGSRSQDIEICRNPSLARPGPVFRFQHVFTTFSNRFLRRICFGQPCAPRHPRTVT